MKRVFLYARVSTEEQAVRGLSIEAQTESLRAWARSNGHKIVDTYIDAGISARKPASKRPELQRLLADAQAGKGDLIVFTKLDRWFRNIAEYYKVQEVLEKYHVDWRTIHEDYDTSTASGRLKINIMLSVAQDEADRTSERIKAVFESKRHKLEPLTGQTPLGYKIDGKKFIKDPQTERAVEAFFQTYLSSGSISEAQRSVSEQYGLNIRYLAAHRMLENTAYKGRYYEMDGMMPPYISEEEFDKIQSMRHRMARKTTKNRTYLFSGIIFCGECGIRMSTHTAQHSEDYRFYNCRNRYEKVDKCSNRSNLQEKKIEEYLLSMLDEKMRMFKLGWEKRESRKKGSGCKSEISALRGKLARLKDLYVNDFISLEDYKKDYAGYSARLAELIEKDRPEKEPNIEALEAVLNAEWRDTYNDASREAKRDFWHIVVREILIYQDRHIEFDLNV